MFTELSLERFKSFKSAVLPLGPFTLLVGTNASGKSNIREAFRFLHGVGRGYSLADILGEKYGAGSERVWAGIRGGTQEVTFQGEQSFAISVALPIGDPRDFVFGSAVFGLAQVGRGPSEPLEVIYRVEVEVGPNGRAPRVAAERLVVGNEVIFDSHPDTDPVAQDDPLHVKVRLRTGKRGPQGIVSFPNQQPVLSQLVEYTKAPLLDRGYARLVLDAFGAMRFLDLSPDAMRRPSLPGQIVLGDHGENLSSALLDICGDPERKQTLLSWIQELTPMDAQDFEFPSGPDGRVLVNLVETGGQKTSANSASDGTLRFLAMIAAMLGPEPARFYFLEELENGIHPARLYLLLQLIEQQVRKGSIQVVASTHSPHLLGLVSGTTLDHASLTYRLKGEQDTRIKRILDIPDARRVIEEQDITRLHASGWLEDAVTLLEDAGEDAGSAT